MKAEFITLRNAIDGIIGSDDSEKTVITDSQAALKALEKPARNQTVESIRMKLIRLNRSKSVKLGWTKAQVGDKGNEAADTLAKNISIRRPKNLNSPPDKT